MNEPKSFSIEGDALKRCFSIYIVWASTPGYNRLYIGKTGDNRRGCNPVISRCGNHFSYNNTHSQIRNKILNHEDWRYTYFFVHFDEYNDNSDHTVFIDKINEMERWLNKKLQKEYLSLILNPYKGNKIIEKFRTPENEKILDSLIEKFKNDFDSQSSTSI